MTSFNIKPERISQNEVINLFKNQLHYAYFDNWQDRSTNSNIEKEYLTGYLNQAGYTAAHISRALDKIERTLNGNKGLYETNKDFYSLLRYGVGVKTEASQTETTVYLINWKQPEQNHFAIAQEVTLKGLDATRRPDIVLYINGIAIGVLELKRGSISLSEGIAQLCSNQEAPFNPWFFNTVQLLMAGNDSQGLRYGTIKTPLKHYLTWKEDTHIDEGNLLHKYLRKLCNKERLLELLYDCVLFDGGIKKLPRAHQYFGLKAAQQHVKQRQGGIIWHTQGAGKSILMVLLAKWILENNPKARVVIVTDRDELDKQIEKVFNASGEGMARSRSGKDLMAQLQQPTPRLICSLVFKFGQRGIDDFEQFIDDLAKQPSTAYGDIFVFVDECHRTQSGKLHRTMKAILPNAVMIGFTGTPLLKQDKQTSIDTFGGYIHTYKFKEAVDDGVVLDLAYQARDVDQRLKSSEHIDKWFNAKAGKLNTWQQNELRKQWATLQVLLSSKSRIMQIVGDVVFDFNTLPRLSEGRGNAILVASSIYEACKYYKEFQQTEFKNKCALITSYNPQTGDISKEDMGDNSETDKQFVYNVYQEILANVTALPQKSKTETYEDQSKETFIYKPADMKLLIVVNKLLTGFDAPSCSVLYLDKRMQDHGLFQAICRTNRLDTPDKEYGLIIDYKDLFKHVEKAIAVYTSEIDVSQGNDAIVTMQNRLDMAKERLANALEQLDTLCEAVSPPKREEDYLAYFCGNSENPYDLEERVPRRVTFYTAVVSLIRAYANIKDELNAIGYTPIQIEALNKKIHFYKELREKVRLRSGEYLDLKPFEADMRHLIDTYIEADAPRSISAFDNMTLVELIVETGIADTIAKKLNQIGSKEGIAETIDNNIRSTIIKEHIADPAFQEKMSQLLDEVIKLRKSQAISYEEYLKHVEDLAKTMQSGTIKTTSSPHINTAGKKALYNALNENEELVLKIHDKVLTAKPAAWKNNPLKQNKLKNALLDVLNNDTALMTKVYDVIYAQDEYQ